MRMYRLAVDLQQFAGEKTEKATPKKRTDARRKGQVAKSVEVAGSLILLAIAGVFLMLGPFLQNQILILFSDIFVNRLTMDVTETNVMALLGHFAIRMLIFLAPVFMIVIFIVFVAYYMQIGWLFTLQPLQPKFSKLNPVSGIKNLFGLRSIVEFLKSMMKLIIVSIVVFMVISTQRDRFLDLAHLPVPDVVAFVWTLAIRLMLFVAVLLFLLALADYFYQKYEYEKNLRMSKQDIKDELKNMEGDPLIKSKIRERQRRMAVARMMQEVPKADVVITNPTHYAVALRYDGKKMDAPMIVAKGQDYLALRIREVARQNDVVTMENKPLARALCERTEVGDTVPADLFQAVAEVLAYVYRLKSRRHAQ